MATPPRLAPGHPGIDPRWTSSAKTGVGTARQTASHVWFTISHGILNEVYYPRLDQACTRDLGLIVTAPGFFSEEKRDTHSKVTCLFPGVPAYWIVNTCTRGNYRIEKEVFTDPRRDVVLQRIRFVPLVGRLSDYRVYVLLAPHIANRGHGNTGWVGDYKGHPMLFAQRGATALALASSAPWQHRSAGFAGTSDGWKELSEHGALVNRYDRAEDGNVALTGEIDVAACDGVFRLALGFGRTDTEAGHRSLASLNNYFHAARTDYIDAWQAWQAGILPLDQPPRPRDLYRISAAVLRLHEAKNFPGGAIASLSIPWGFNRTDDDLGGYHLVWPRDLAETGGGLLAAGAPDDARRVLNYLSAVQEADGHWPQNMWLDGSPYWEAIQLDESAFPILLFDLARRNGALRDGDVRHAWPMIKRAASFVVRNGPVTQQDRWEEDPGYSPFTLAVEIAGLLAAAELATLNGEPEVANYLTETADTWYSQIDNWIYATGNHLSIPGNAVHVSGYYVRIAPPETADAASPLDGFVPIKNRPPGQSNQPASLIVSPDALALVRFGLRAANDPRIVNTVRLIDALLKVETPCGPAWRRYNEDGYGEKEDGSAFDGTGVGRPWPLLTGERSHYELMAGRRDEAERLLGAMEAFADDGGLIPEQVWDGPDLPDKELYFGRASGSAMPLVWAHAEYIKLRRSLKDGKVFDLPPQTVQRYLVDKVQSQRDFWRFNHKLHTLLAGHSLRVEVLAAAVVRWSHDAWVTTTEMSTTDSGLGMHYVDLDTSKLPPGSVIELTFYWKDAGKWEGKNFAILVTAAGNDSTTSTGHANSG
jgi:glucoamylase